MKAYTVSGYGPISGERVVRSTSSRTRANWFREWLEAAGYLDVQIVARVRA